MREIYSAFFITRKKKEFAMHQRIKGHEWEISVDEKWFLFAFMYKCDMQNAFDFVSHSAGHKSLSAMHGHKKREIFSLSDTTVINCIFLYNHRSRCHFFTAISIAIYAGWLHFLRYAELFIYFRSDRQHEKKASLYAKLSFSCFMNILTNINFACVHQHCQYFPFFYVECLPHAFLHSLIPPPSGESPGKFAFFYLLLHLFFHLSRLCDLHVFFYYCRFYCPLLPLEQQRLFHWWLYGFG